MLNNKTGGDRCRQQDTEHSIPRREPKRQIIALAALLVDAPCFGGGGKRLESNERRIAELKRLFIKIYEDNASGRLTDERYDMLSQTYEAEQKQLEAEAITLQQEIEVQERQNENIEKFIQKAHKYVGIEELDGYTLRELVSAIYVDAPDKSSGKRVQPIHIKYDGLGFIPLNELMKKETA